MKFCASKTGLSNPTLVFLLRSKAVPLKFVFVHASVLSCVTFVLSYVPHLSFFWYLEKAMFRDCGISWVFSFILFR